MGKPATAASPKFTKKRIQIAPRECRVRRNPSRMAASGVSIVSLPSTSRARDLLLPGGVLMVCLGDAGLAVIAVMDHHAIAKDQRFAFRNGPASILVGVAGKIAQPERIGCEQTVAARVPGRRVPEALRMIEN